MIFLLNNKQTGFILNKLSKQYFYSTFPRPRHHTIWPFSISGSRRGLITVEVGLELMQTLPDRAQFRNRRPVMQKE